jgi:hypothetical protein
MNKIVILVVILLQGCHGNTSADINDDASKKQLNESIDWIERHQAHDNKIFFGRDSGTSQVDSLSVKGDIEPPLETFFSIKDDIDFKKKLLVTFKNNSNNLISSVYLLIYFKTTNSSYNETIIAEKLRVKLKAKQTASITLSVDNTQDITKMFVSKYYVSGKGVVFNGPEGVLSDVEYESSKNTPLIKMLGKGN